MDDDYGRGDGDGYGSASGGGYGSASGGGYGYGTGFGDRYGCGDGGGYGTGSGYGSGYGSGSGSRSGTGSGDGFGYGYGSGDGSSDSSKRMNRRQIMKQKDTLHIWYTGKDFVDDTPKFALMITAAGDYLPSDWVLVGPTEIEFDVPDNFDPRPAQIANLEAKRSEVMAKAQKSIDEINQRIQELRAISYEVPHD